ncbi:type I restriction enzyme endonuclease domain-containing protein [Leyella stercorea]|uniref:Type I site-specific deoxyribonuclease HsdR family n=1 Tax=Leyella stercorea CAG:629 TaxID=1263103 RepID=R7H2P8_9BACT|nr:type I restriction enzyme endonuclease domain-containing protein [Leyella stercorea]CDE33944.1 type I site-specific deoxyribonuclease HsdR family [Leyella stercorea CAG:629]
MPLKNTKVKLLEQLLRRVIDSVMKVNKVKAVDFTQRLNEIVKRYNDRTDDLVFADEIITEVAAQLTELLNKIKNESQLPDGIPDIEVKAFYDILKAVAEKYGFAGDFTEEQFKRMALEIKGIVDDKCQFIDWDKREDIKASMKVAIILTLAKEKYPPYTKDEVFKEIFEQAENFKKNRIGLQPRYRNIEESAVEMAAEPHASK